MAQMTASSLPTIGDVILAWRKYRKMRPTELVREAGIKKGYLSALEHNKRATPQEAYLTKLADALDVPLQDIYGRRMPPKDGVAVTIPSSKQEVAGQGSKQISAKEDGDSEGHEEENRANSTSLPTIANPSLDLTDSLLLSTFEQIEILIKSKPLSKEAIKKVAAGLLDATSLLLKQHE